MRHTKAVLGGVFGFGLAVSLAAVPVGGAVAAPAPDTAADSSVTAAYTGSQAEEAGNKAFFEAVMKSAAKKQAAEPGIQAVTVTYDASAAPTFAAEIARSTQIWNGAVSNVTLQEGSGADFTYREGNDPRGSYASTDGHGSGYIFLDYAQNQQYDSTRVTTHETGHVLGLPDNYSGPCSELMSGGGPGPSCTNSNPNQAERNRVDQLWANGISQLDLKAAFVKAH